MLLSAMPVPSLRYVKRVVDAPADVDGPDTKRAEPTLESAASRVQPRPMSTRRMIICGDTHYKPTS